MMGKFPRAKTKSCVVIASGPSAGKYDLRKLADLRDKGLITIICVNESYKALPFKPDIICIGDWKLWPHVEDDYAKNPDIALVVGTGHTGEVGKGFKGANPFFQIRTDPTTKMYKKGFHWNIEKQPIPLGFNVITEVVLPYVCWAGFEECSLIGCDCTQNGYFYGNNIRAMPNKKQLINPRAMQCYQTIATTMGLPTRIYNIGFDGLLEVFPRVPYETLLDATAIDMGIYEYQEDHGDSRNDIIVTGYYTPDKDYKEIAHNMKSSCERFGLEVFLEEVPSEAAKHNAITGCMAWVLNCSLCGGHVKRMRQRFPKRRLLYLDADAEMVARPKLFLDDRDWISDTDFAAPYIDSKNVRALVSNVLYFRPNAVTDYLIDRWINKQLFENTRLISGRYRKPYRPAWDQVTLRDEVEHMKNECPSYRAKRLPNVYGKIDPYRDRDLMPTDPDDEIVIVQHQASRRHRETIGIEKGEE